MAIKTPLTVILTGLLFSTSAAAQIQGQVQHLEPFAPQAVDPFAPRIYGSTAITPADYQGATQAAPVVTYSQTSNIRRVVEPVTQDIQSTISAPITYGDTGVVKAQHFKQGDLSPEAYQALLDEADRVRAYQSTDNSYTGISYDAASSTQVYTSPSPAYQIELFEPSISESYTLDATSYISTSPTVSYTTSSTVPTTQSLGTTSSHHTVLKGDTLYNISKRYDVSVDALRSANGLTDNTIGLGQSLSIPGHTTMAVNQTTIIAPITTTTESRGVTLVRNVEPVPGLVSAGGANIYAVLPKDTVYSISRRACVSAGAIIAENNLANPNALQPGQKLNMPSGHCLN